MNALLSDANVHKLRLALVFVLCAGMAYYVERSIHWPLMGDSPIMHYVVFLMHHGMQPYRTITDNNFPGAYMSEALAMRIFGAGNLGWRLYEYFLLGTLTVCLAMITRHRDWVAGLFAAALFILQHGVDGPSAANQREQVATILFLIGYVLLFYAVRKQRPLPFLFYGLIAGFAVSIKPLSLLLCFSVFALAIGVLWKRRVPVGRYIGLALAGFAVALSFSVGFLVQHGALGAFWFQLHRITPAYVALAHPSFANMLRFLLPKDVRWFVLLIGVPLFLADRHWDWERWALLVGALAGVATFFLQHKGFYHHRYTFEIFLFAIVGVELLNGLRSTGWPRGVAVLGVLIIMGYFVPSYIIGMHQVVDNSDLTLTLEKDLTHLGGQKLQRKVMCFDMVFGCLNALYQLQLVQNTGYTGDLLLFFPEQGYASTYYRDLYWQNARRDPADVLVITNEWLQKFSTFGKMNNWPEFLEYLHAQYTLVTTREFPMEARQHMPAARKPTDEPYKAYRIYVRNGSPLHAEAAHDLGVTVGQCSIVTRDSQQACEAFHE